MNFTLFDFSKLKQIFQNLKILSVENKNNRKAVKPAGPAIVGDNNTLTINVLATEAEEKKIKLSDKERYFLEQLAEGCTIISARDGTGIIANAVMFGCGQNQNQPELVKLLPGMIRKGIIESDGKNHYVISPLGKRIIQWLDRNEMEIYE